MSSAFDEIHEVAERLGVDNYHATDAQDYVELGLAIEGQLQSRIDELEEKLMGHLVFKSQTPTTNPDMAQTIAQGLGESILEHHPIQYTEHGTAGFVEVRVLDATEPPIEQEGSDE